MEAAAQMAKREAAEKTGLPVEKIGVFFITPCTAKVTDIKMPLGIEKSSVDGAIAVSQVSVSYTHLRAGLESPGSGGFFPSPNWLC